MAIAAVKFSVLDLCYRGEYLAAGESLNLRPGERPENVSGGNSEQGMTLLVAGIIQSAMAGIQQSGNQGLARELLLESVTLDSSLSAEARAWLTWSYQWTGDFGHALAIAETVLAEASLTPRLRFRTLLLKVISCCHLDCLGDGENALRQMESLYDSQDSLSKGKFHLQRGRVLSLQKEIDRAIVEYDCAINFFHEWGDLRCEAVTAQNLAGVYFDVGMYTEAHQYAERAVKLFHELGDKTYEAKTLDVIAQVFLQEGKLPEAQSVIERAVSLIEQDDQALSECRETQHKIKQLASQKAKDCHARIADNPRRTHSVNPEKREVMTPTDCADLILQNPDNASPLYDLLVFASSGNDNPEHQAELDHLEAMVYAKTQDSEEKREAYRRSRLIRPVTSDS